MSSSMFRTVGAPALALSLLTAFVAQPILVGQEKAAKKAKGRLPPYFAQVVTEKQRTNIYAIQKKYADQLEALEQQVKSLQEQRDSEIEGVLTDEQKEKLYQLRADAAGKRKSKTAAAAETTETTETSEASATIAPTATAPAATSAARRTTKSPGTTSKSN